MPLAIEKKTENTFFLFFSFSRGTDMPLTKAKSCLSRPFREARTCLSKRQNRASRGSKTVPFVKKTRFFLFRKMDVPLAKAQMCLSRKQNRASRKQKKEVFFFISVRHGRPSREGEIVPLAKAKPCLSQKRHFYKKNVKREERPMKNRNIKKIRKKKSIYKAKNACRKNKKTKFEGSAQSTTRGSG